MAGIEKKRFFIDRWQHVGDAQLNFPTPLEELFAATRYKLSFTGKDKSQHFRRTCTAQFLAMAPLHPHMRSFTAICIAHLKQSATENLSHLNYFRIFN
jgi:hypothetical protein